MEKYGGAVLQNHRPITKLDSSVPGEQKEVTGWFPKEPEDCARMVVWLPDIPRSAIQSSSEA
jgi:hypothetical protein